MDSQGESDVLESTLLPPPHQPNPSLSHSNPEDALSSIFLRFQVVEITRNMPLIEGSTWAVVSKSWWRRFEKAATGEVDKEGGVNEDRLGPVDNSPLLDTDGDLNENLVEGVDFECIPEVAWDWLTILYVFFNRQTSLVLLTP
jgi:ubiquitin carboxyl-terminal hydrolase 4/11/15